MRALDGYRAPLLYTRIPEPKDALELLRFRSPSLQPDMNAT
jgi:hypothetical protein